MFAIFDNKLSYIYIRFPVGWRILVIEYIASIGIPLDIFELSFFNVFWHFCIMEELSGSVAVAVGFSDT